MAQFIIPFTNIGLQSVNVALGDSEYNIELQFSTRENVWYMNFLDQDGNDLRSGIKVVLDFALTTAWRDGEQPDGLVLATRIDGNTGPIRKDDMGTNAIVIYDDLT